MHAQRHPSLKDPRRLLQAIRLLEGRPIPWVGHIPCHNNSNVVTDIVSKEAVRITFCRQRNCESTGTKGPQATDSTGCLAALSQVVPAAMTSDQNHLNWAADVSSAASMKIA
jgi:hypothetical protein